MANLICYDLQGCPVDYFTQWDLNITIDILGVDTAADPRVCFRNKLSKEPIVVRPSVIDDGIRVEIPNELLQQAIPVIIEVFYEYNDGCLRTKHIFSIPVVPSLRSTAHRLVQNIDYVDWIKLQARARNLMNDINWEKPEDIIIVDDDEPEISDILWFDTSAVEIKK